MASKIEILDSVCGSGKTQGIIKWMNDHPQDRYLYISPLLSEINDRIPEACGTLDFDSPDTETSKTKSEHLLSLLSEGKNISFTHALFKDMNKHHMQYIRDWGYTLIIDEEIDFISPFTEYKVGDIDYLLDKGSITIDDDQFGKVTWIDNKEYRDMKYSLLKKLSDLGMVYALKSSDRGSKAIKREIMVTQLPIELIASSARCILLTYMFAGSVMDSFVRMRGLEVSTFNEVIPAKSEAAVKRSISRLIQFTGDKSSAKLNKYSMSTNWYMKANIEELGDIGKAIYNIALTNKTKKEDVMWTCPKEYTGKIKRGQKRVAPTSYKSEDCFVSCNTRATNEYSNKSLLVHAFNRHPNLVISRYLSSFGYGVDPDKFALAELIQWIWRSRIRNDEPIKLCLLSNRMNKLFKDWLDLS